MNTQDFLNRTRRLVSPIPILIKALADAENRWRNPNMDFQDADLLQYCVEVLQSFEALVKASSVVNTLYPVLNRSPSPFEVAVSNFDIEAGTILHQHQTFLISASNGNLQGKIHSQKEDEISNIEIDMEDLLRETRDEIVRVAQERLGSDAKAVQDLSKNIRQSCVNELKAEIGAADILDDILNGKDDHDPPPTVVDLDMCYTKSECLLLVCIGTSTGAGGGVAAGSLIGAVAGPPGIIIGAGIGFIASTILWGEREKRSRQQALKKFTAETCREFSNLSSHYVGKCIKTSGRFLKNQFTAVERQLNLRWQKACKVLDTHGLDEDQIAFINSKGEELIETTNVLIADLNAYLNNTKPEK